MTATHTTKVYLMNKHEHNSPSSRDNGNHVILTLIVGGAVVGNMILPGIGGVILGGVLGGIFGAASGKADR